MKTWMQSALVAFSLSTMALPVLAEPVQTKVAGNYHLTVYPDAFGEALDLELFTKLADRQVFFGVGCSAMSPMPMLQVLMFDDDIVSETPKFMSASVQIDGGASIKLDAVLKPTLSADEISNRMLLQFASQRGDDMRVLKQQYLDLLQALQKGQNVKVTLSHRTIGEQAYDFSLAGMDELLRPYQNVCR